MTKTDKKQKGIIAIDGGGTKTAAILADSKGKILAKVKTGASNPNKNGIEKASREISLAILKVSKKRKITLTYIALAGGTQRNQKIKRDIKKSLKKIKEISFIFKGKVIIEGDEKAAFRAGTEEKNGVLLIAGAGSLCYGWKDKKEVKNLGWDYLLGDEGGGFWTGQKALQAICHNLDNRGPKTLLKDLIFKALKIKNDGDLIKKIYQPAAVKIISEISVLVDKASEKGDKIAKDILIKASEELVLAAKAVIKKLNFKNEKFPIVLTGGMFRSKIISERVKKIIKKFAPKSYFVLPKLPPVTGALKIAIEKLN